MKNMQAGGSSMGGGIIGGAPVTTFFSAPYDRTQWDETKCIYPQTAGYLEKVVKNILQLRGDGKGVVLEHHVPAQRDSAKAHIHIHTLHKMRAIGASPQFLRDHKFISGSCTSL